MPSQHFHSIPLFDMREFDSTHAEIQHNFIERLRIASHEIGFFYISHHGVSLELMQKALELTKLLFNLPPAIKDQISISLSEHFRGYGKLGQEMTEGLPDFKETFDLGFEQAARDMKKAAPYFILQGPNQWPTHPLLDHMNWKSILLDYLHLVHDTGKKVMQALAMVLGLSKHFFDPYFSAGHADAYTILRLLRYPPAQKNIHGEFPLGVGPHTDAGCLVLLLQDDIGGLQVQNLAGEWIDAQPIPGTFVVNIGEMLQLWSNHYFSATPHRVINKTSHERYSIPFFLEPHLSTVVSPLAISDSLWKNKKYEKPKGESKIIYGEHILRVYSRSFG